jgi:SulP family sulfate permease
MVNPSLLYDSIRQSFHGTDTLHIRSLDEERIHAVDFLMRRCPGEERALVERFFSYFSREVFQEGATLWRQGAKSDCAKVLVSGDLISSLENEAGTTEAISIGSVIGESGLVDNQNRNSTVQAKAESVLYSLSRESWELLKEKDPRCAHLLYHIVVRYLMLRVQHCSNRIFETRCLPI